MGGKGKDRGRENVQQKSGTWRPSRKGRPKPKKEGLSTTYEKKSGKAQSSKKKLQGAVERGGSTATEEKQPEGVPTSGETRGSTAVQEFKRHKSRLSQPRKKNLGGGTWKDGDELEGDAWGPSARGKIKEEGPETGKKKKKKKEKGGGGGKKKKTKKGNSKERGYRP